MSFSDELYEACRKLPVFDMVWFHQNIQSLCVLEDQIRGLEIDNLQALTERESTPVAETLFLQTLSQCWMFGMYELFRTWRQMINEVLVFAEEYERNPKSAKTPVERSDIDLPELDEMLEKAFYGDFFEKVKTDNTFRENLIKTKAIFKKGFQPIEELRVLIAKFEIAQTGNGRRRFAMPYARISYENGSLYWSIMLKDGQRKFASRQEIAQQYLDLANAINIAYRRL